MQRVIKHSRCICQANHFYSCTENCANSK